MVTLGSAGRVIRLLRPHRQSDVTRPHVRQLERVAHVELQHAEAAGQILQGPNDGMLHFRRGPLPELVVTQVSLQRFGDAGGELAVGLLRRRLEINRPGFRRLTMGPVWPLLGPWAIAPEYPLEGYAHGPPPPRIGLDHPRHI